MARVEGRASGEQHLPCPGVAGEGDIPAWKPGTRAEAADTGTPGTSSLQAQHYYYYYYFTEVLLLYTAISMQT